MNLLQWPHLLTRRAGLSKSEQQTTEALAAVVHEMRDPLTAGLAAVRALDLGTDDQTRQRACRMIERQLLQLARLTDDLFDFSRYRLGMGRLEVDRVDLCQVVREIADTFASASARQHRIDTSVPREPIWAHIDTARLRQVLSNLLRNAVQHTPAAGRISIHLKRQGARAEILVRDTGHGIVRELLPHIFEPFRTGTTDALGLGVGLAIARQLVELHGGRIQVSSPGAEAGTDFLVTLPLRCESQHAVLPREREGTLRP
jgi:signal transduction histidine kinase